MIKLELQQLDVRKLDTTEMKNHNGGVTPITVMAIIGIIHHAIVLPFIPLIVAGIMGNLEEKGGAPSPYVNLSVAF